MVKVVPFKAYRYNSDKVDDLSKTVAPPYDVMKGEKLDMIQDLSPWNIAWVTKNKPQGSDSNADNQYIRAKDLLNNLINDGVLAQDNREGFYVYGQNFSVLGQTHFRFGFVGLLELEEFAKGSPEEGIFAGVLQHEETLPKDIEDRLNLSRETLAQFGQIFVIYPDPEKKVDTVLDRAMRTPPLIDMTDHLDVRHRLWAINDRTDIDTISDHMESKYLIIADGHHRYKTALALNKERNDLEGSKYRMLTFVNMANTGLVILPTHRLVQNLEGFNTKAFLDKLGADFIIERYKTKEDMFRKMESSFIDGRHAFGLFMNNGSFYTAILNNTLIMNDLLHDKSEELRQLDVSVLHSVILEKTLGIDKKMLEQGTMKGGGYIVYVKGIGDAVDEAIAKVKSDAQVVFFMNPTRIEEVEAVATNFECMPQKSTFFYPKVWTGFTINMIK